MTEVAGIHLLITSLEMWDDPLWGLAKSVPGPQSSGPSRYVLLRGIQVVSEANQDASYAGIPSTYGLKKQPGVSGVLFTGYRFTKAS